LDIHVELADGEIQGVGAIMVIRAFGFDDTVKDAHALRYGVQRVL
jgi:hypothetical protein